MHLSLNFKVKTCKEVKLALDPITDHVWGYLHQFCNVSTKGEVIMDVELLQVEFYLYGMHKA
jgi:hypothetical protein